MTKEEAEKLARETVQSIVDQMYENGYPVEMTHKAGFSEKFIPIDWIVGWEQDFEGTLALTLIEGWSSKVALRELLCIVREDARRMSIKEK